MKLESDGDKKFLCPNILGFYDCKLCGNHALSQSKLIFFKPLKKLFENPTVSILPYYGIII